MPKPVLSIIMPAFNSGSYIGDAVESLLSQTYSNFELIIIEDGSTDDTKDIIGRFDDLRIKRVFNDANRGIPYCRNAGIDMVQGELISFFDSDDKAHPEKFQKQIEFLESHSDHGIVGTSVIIIDKDGNETGRWNLKLSHDKILPWMLFRNCFVTSSVVFRRDVFAGSGFRFPDGLEIGEDYLLWWKLLQSSRSFIMPGYLTYYRCHPESIMSRRKDKMQSYEKEVFSVILKDIDIDVQDEELLTHLQLREAKVTESGKDLLQLSGWLLRIASALSALPRYSMLPVASVILNRWLKGSLRTDGDLLLSLKGLLYLNFYFRLIKLVCIKRPESAKSSK